jgi:hypothetical protein
MLQQRRLYGKVLDLHAAVCLLQRFYAGRGVGAVPAVGVLNPSREMQQATQHFVC